ncbi:MAG: apolipoprotein N-acyltransferase [Rickettsiales bacterium]|nr:apolipoprotein N-acyltransferase [Rickettsiales bacterium]|tara:strand:- start:15779 stop:17245 length:1467 start_codon:yes stop_codon:yes gene_type:complete
MFHAFLLFIIGVLLGLANLKPTFFILTPLITPSLALLTFPDSSSSKLFKRLKLGWSFAFGYFLISLYWIPRCLLVNADQFLWLIPLTFFGIPAICALFMGASWALIPWMRFSGVLRVFLFALSWALMEAFLYLPVGGFPWSLLGYVWHRSLPIAQIAYPLTIHGLSFLTILWGSSYYIWCSKRSKTGAISSHLSPILIILVLFLSFLGAYFWGLSRLAKPTKMHDVPSLRIVQPNIPQKIKWHPDYQQINLKKILRLTYAPGYNSVDLIIWPEAALTYRLTPSLLQFITKPLSAQQYLITGILNDIKDDPLNVHNMLIALNNEGTIIDQYRKHHLVPFGEYVPASDFLSRYLSINLQTLAGGAIQTLSGSKPETITLGPMINFSPQICFETLFSNLVASNPSKPKWILNLTNDAWFGRSTGPHQHVQISRFRAIQSNLPLVRAASTGISAIIDNHGQIIQSLDSHVTGVIDYKKRPDPKIRSSLTGRL